ncbi:MULTISPECIES: hypothetical protein [Symbiopectobacterium]|uniref:hypothetical protein n=1 Tax=Symbiopectobacterium TaxID=801 RepID=UPI001A1B8264|nr:MULTISPECIES: hypothetical protein [Symbiopectobacterium]MBG6247004.1 hypothetical protein [Candidatus Symbiopectobacterium sp. PLON1]MBT9429075.1 hypothetical protein [Candidatus Symbiopectobacterium endolongispinus]
MKNNKPFSQIEFERKHISRLYVDFCQRHYGSSVAIMKLENGSKTTVEVSESNVSSCMVKYIENVGVEEFGLEAATSQIKTLYINMQNKDGSKLTPLGVGVMSEMILAAVSDTIDNNGANVLEVGNA